MANNENHWSAFNTRYTHRESAPGHLQPLINQPDRETIRTDFKIFPGKTYFCHANIIGPDHNKPVDVLPFVTSQRQEVMFRENTCKSFFPQYFTFYERSKSATMSRYL